MDRLWDDAVRLPSPFRFSFTCHRLHLGSVTALADDLCIFSRNGHLCRQSRVPDKTKTKNSGCRKVNELRLDACLPAAPRPERSEEPAVPLTGPSCRSCQHRLRGDPSLYTLSLLYVGEDVDSC